MDTVFLNGHVNTGGGGAVYVNDMPFSGEYLFEWQHSLSYFQNTGLDA